VNAEQLFTEWALLWEPPKRLPLSQWAEENFYTSPEYSSTTSRLRLHAYQREPLDCFTDPRVSDIVVKSGTQMLKTLLMQVALAYVAIEDPGPCLLSQYKEADAEAFSKERLVPMIRDIPGLQKIPGLSSKSRASGSTSTYKEFPGGSWSLVGAGAAGNAARRSIRFYFGDEINKYELTKEGAFTDLAAERTATFGTRSKRVYCCSPTTPEGAISRMYDASDQRRPWVPCPDCGEFQVLKWIHVKWSADVPREDRPASARYECEHCGSRWDDLKRWTACSGIRWVAEKPFRGVAGFGDLGHLYSPYKTLADMVAKWLTITADKSAQASESLRVFINTNLADEYVEKGEAPEWQRLYDRREDYPLRLVPRGGLFVVAGADVQKDRIEAQVVAYGHGKESWQIDYAVLDGDTSRPEVWAKLSEFLNQTYRHESGVDLPIIRFAIDSGYATQDVYDWARRQGPGRVAVVKGQDNGVAIVGQPATADVSSAGKRLKRGVKVWPLNVSMLKSEFYGWLRLDRPTEEAMGNGEPYPPGYCHFPEMNEEFFRQLCAEQLVTRIVKGYRKQEWTKTRDRNEALDTRIYARAAASMFGIDRFQEMQWRQLEAQIADRVRPALEAKREEVRRPDPEPVPAQQQVQQQPQPRGGWIGRQRGWLNR
jgi:phage terminase large subunit GpA-like protein